MVSSVCTGFQLPVWKNDNKTELGTAQTPEENTVKGSQSAHGHLAPERSLLGSLSYEAGWYSPSVENTRLYFMKGLWELHKLNVCVCTHVCVCVCVSACQRTTSHAVSQDLILWVFGTRSLIDVVISK